MEKVLLRSTHHVNSYWHVVSSLDTSVANINCARDPCDIMSAILNIVHMSPCYRSSRVSRVQHVVHSEKYLLVIFKCGLDHQREKSRWQVLRALMTHHLLFSCWLSVITNQLILDKVWELWKISFLHGWKVAQNFNSIPFALGWAIGYNLQYNLTSLIRHSFIRHSFIQHSFIQHPQYYNKFLQDQSF
jgi:hypothetical protein